MPSITYTYDTTNINGTWTTWVADRTTASTSTNALQLSSAVVWRSWVTYNSSTTISTNQPIAYKPYVPPTPEELAEQKAKQEAAAEARRQAEVRADALLAEFLDAMQRDQLSKDKSFIVESETGKRYEVKAGKRVAELGADGKPVALYCIHPSDQLPAGDVMLAQKLMLETDEKSFLKIANRTPVGVH